MHHRARIPPVASSYPFSPRPRGRTSRTPLGPAGRCGVPADRHRSPDRAGDATAVAVDGDGRDRRRRGRPARPTRTAAGVPAVAAVPVPAAVRRPGRVHQPAHRAELRPGPARPRRAGRRVAGVLGRGGGDPARLRPAGRPDPAGDRATPAHRGRAVAGPASPHDPGPERTPPQPGRREPLRPDVLDVARGRPRSGRLPGRGATAGRGAARHILQRRPRDRLRVRAVGVELVRRGGADWWG